MKKFARYLPYLILVVAIGFNLWSLWPETTIKSDLNDNIFQLGLLTRMNQAWEKKFSTVLDHWVPNWAVGYPLPFYYPHLPHLALVALYQLLGSILTLPQLLHGALYLILVLTPLAFWIGARQLGFSKLAASLVALFASQLSTDGLYGLDASSFVWRGYGLSLQALSVFFLPLAVGFAWSACQPADRLLQKGRYRQLAAAIFFLTACFASHLATGYIGLLSIALIPLVHRFWQSFTSLLVIFGGVFLLLAYWFVPLALNNQYHGISFWDPPAKWFSYGFKEVVNLFLNGDLLDFGRRPVLTLLAILGFLVAAYRAQKPRYRYLVFLFLMWFVLFFGRPTLGSLIYLLPLAKEYHLHRFIIGVHFASLFLIGLGSEWLIQKLSAKLATTVLIIILLAWPVYQQTNNYLVLNKEWLIQANQKFAQEVPDFQKIVQALSERPRGRIWAGRPGNWGRDFKVGPTPVYMALSSRGFETSGFLPETWSLNSDPEQFFDEQRLEHYQLYNIRYLVTPVDSQLPNFAKETFRSGNYKLAEVATNGYFDLGYSDWSVLSTKENILNITHAWLVSDWVKQKQFPQLILGRHSKESYRLKMVDEITYEIDSQTVNLFNPPLFPSQHPFKINPQGQILKETVDFQKYTVQVQVDQKSLVVFKMTFHPQWQVKIDNQPSEKIMVFPNLMAVKIPTGEHQIIFEYRSSQLKFLLLITGFIGLGVVLFLLEVRHKNQN